MGEYKFHRCESHVCGLKRQHMFPASYGVLGQDKKSCQSIFLLLNDSSIKIHAYYGHTSAYAIYFAFSLLKEVLLLRAGSNGKKH